MRRRNKWRYKADVDVAKTYNSKRDFDERSLNRLGNKNPSFIR